MRNSGYAALSESKLTLLHSWFLILRERKWGGGGGGGGGTREGEKEKKKGEGGGGVTKVGLGDKLGWARHPVMQTSW